ncbi:MAG: alpha/beta-type small acid-soluble spore protein [Syntrophomonadaceae bacterium]|jgi:hypothetical protein|nr:alpha/beta-type small acid-soluble spore protein [Syntrophomonadaceae bacterium]
MAAKKTKLLTERDLLKAEVAEELGIWDLVQDKGWGALSNKICGQVGGIVARRLKERNRV